MAALQFPTRSLTMREMTHLIFNNVAYYNNRDAFPRDRVIHNVSAGIGSSNRFSGVE